MASSKKTYDTDSIVLRRILALNPLTNGRISANTVLVTGSKGVGSFQDTVGFLSTLGVPTSIAGGSGITVTNTNGIYTIATSSIGLTDLTSTTMGLGTLGYLSTTQLTSTIANLGQIYNSTILVAGTNITFTSNANQITINGQAGGGGLGITDLTSTTKGLGTLNYLSSFNKISSLNISTGSLFASFVSSQQVTASSIRANIFVGDGSQLTGITGTGGGLVITDLTSTTKGLGLLGYLSSFNKISSLNISTGSLFASFVSSQQVTASSITANIFLGDGSQLTGITSTGSSGTTYYLNYSVAGVPYGINNNALQASLTNSSQNTDLNVSIPYNSGNGTLIRRFYTSTLIPSFIPGGIWDLNLYVSTNSYYVRVFYKILKLASDGITITQIGTNSVSSDIYPTDNTISQLILSIEVPYTVLNNGDIVYIEIYASNSDISQAHTLTVYYEDSTYSHLHTSFLQNVTTTISSINISTGSLFASFVSSQQVTASSITANKFVGDGSMLTNLPGGGGGIGITDLTSTTKGLGTLNYLSSFNVISSVNLSSGSIYASFLSSQQITASSIRANIFVGDGSQLTGITGTGGGLVITDLTSTTKGLGTLNYLSSFNVISSVNLSSGSIYASFLSSQQITASSIRANKFVGDGSLISNVPNLGVTYITAGTGIGVNTNTGNITVSNNGVLSITQGDGISITGTGGSYTITATGGTAGTVATADMVSTVIGIQFRATSSLTSSLQGLSYMGYLSSFATISSLNISSGSLFASLLSSQQITASSIRANKFVGDGSLLTNVAGTGGLAIADLTSTIIGLGTFGYLSSAAELISSPQLTSSLVGLGSMTYISSFDTLSSLNISSGSLYTSTTSTTEITAGRVNFGTLYVNNAPIIFDQYGNLQLSFQTL